MGFDGRQAAQIDTSPASPAVAEQAVADQAVVDHKATEQTATAPTMQAVLQAGYGSTDVLRVGTTPRPHAREGEVVLRVHAAGLDRGTWHLMTGRPYLMRLMGFGFFGPKNPVLGLDVAGTVVEVGAQVTRFRVGDEVFGIGQGSFAEFTRAREDKLVRKPQSLSFEQAAVMSVSGLTALQALRDAGQLRANRRVLIIGASGGVGTFAVQLARAYGAEVTGVCSSSKVEAVRALGAAHVIDYTQGLRRRLPALRSDLGHRRQYPARALAPRAHRDGTAGLRRQRKRRRFDRRLRASSCAHCCSAGSCSSASRCWRRRGARSRHRSARRATSRPAPSPRASDRSYPLDQVAGAMRLLSAGQVRGKIAITV